MQRLYELWGLSRKFDRFPGSQPVSIERRHFPILRKSDYVICDKSDGERFLCLMDTVDGNKTCNLINRKSEFVPIKLRPPKECFEGTILDGEIVVENGKKIFLVFDVVAWAGKCLVKLDLPTRLKHLLDNQRKFIRSPKDDIRIRTKMFSPLKDALVYKNQYIPTLKYQTDGYILTPLFDPVQTGTHNTMFKWKPFDDITIDFLVKKTIWTDNKDGFDMYIQDKGELIFESHLSRKHLGKKFEKLLTKEGSLVLECKYENNVWKPIRHRDDKNYPNSRFCFYRTLTNINENIKEDEIISLLRS